MLTPPPFEVMEDGDPEACFFEWLEAQLPAVPSVINESYKSASLFSTVAALNLHEGRECEHVGDLANPTVVPVDQDSRKEMSKVVQEAMRRIMLEYSVSQVREVARVDAIARLNAISAPSFPFHLLCFSLFILNLWSLIWSTVSCGLEC